MARSTLHGRCVIRNTDPSRSPALPHRGCGVLYIPNSSPKMAQQPWQAGDAESRMVEVGASASPFKEAADGAEQQVASGTAQTEAAPANGNDNADATKPPDQSTTLLENFLTSISKLDDFKFFSEPVREQDAPGYFNVIKHPMDLQTMSEKARAHQYSTWTAFVEDFKLMCNNAMVYNQKRSRVHKTAVTMLRAGIKQLQHMEADGCKALGCPLPAVPLASLDQPSPATATAIGTIPSKPAAAPTDGAAGSRAPSKPPVKAPPKKAAKTSPPKKARVSKLAGGPPKTRTGAPVVAFAEGEDVQDLPLVEDACYSSFSDTDEEGSLAPEAVASAISTGQWLQWMGQTVVTQQLRPPTASATNVTAMPAFEGKQAAAELWKTQRRGAEWRVRWLELRLQELAGREQRYQQLLAATSAAPTTAEQAPTFLHAPMSTLHEPAAAHVHSLGEIAAAPFPGASPFEQRHRSNGPEAMPMQQQTPDGEAIRSPPLSADVSIGIERGPADGEAAPASDASPASRGDVHMAKPMPQAGPLSGDPAGADRGTAADHSLSQQAHQPPATLAPHDQPQQTLLRQRHARVELQLLEPAHIASHPFFAAHGGVKRIKQPLLEAEDANMDDAYLAPCTFVALDMLEARLEALQMQMHQVPGVARPAPSMGGQGMRGRGRGRGMHPQKRMRLPVPSQPVLDRQVSKRRREDGDWVDGMSMYQSTPRIERMQVDTISTPAVRQLSTDELKARQHAIHVRDAHPPAKDQDEPADMAEGEDSSSEDTSDAMYAVLHAAHEAEEHLKFTASANAGGGAQKKPPSKAELRGELDAKATQGMQLPPAASAPPSFGPPLKVGTAAAATSHSAELPKLEPQALAEGAVPSLDQPAVAAAVDVALQPSSPRSGTAGRGAAGRKNARTSSLEGGSPTAGQSGRPRGRPPGSHGRGRGRAQSGSGRSGRSAGRGSGLNGRTPQGAALAVANAAIDGNVAVADGAGEPATCAAANGQDSKSEQYSN